MTVRPRPSERPLIALCPDIMPVSGVDRLVAAQAYADAILRAGGLPVVVPPDIAILPDVLARSRGVVLLGGDDPMTEPFGEPTHPKAVVVRQERQVFETALLESLADLAPDHPVLGVCLGMQMMALVGGGRLDQHMPESTPTHAEHWACDHAVAQSTDVPSVALNGIVRSKHHQAVSDPGRLRVIARAPDDVIEAVDDPDRRFYVGVQWHPERTSEKACGAALFDRFIEAAASSG